MGLFTPDLYRNLVIGFAVGALLVVMQHGGSAIPEAIAATFP